ncbi:MAG: hypothetical protein KBT89_06260 [Gammaproteobacteria bacterium]|nr:hypothetical protein [Gammaproteobacteria bacterium]
MGFISHFFLPKEADFNAALFNQAQACHKLVADLFNLCSQNDAAALRDIAADTKQARKLKTRNMQELLNVLITPYDKESIFRMITQLDWITLAVKHFQLEARVYGTHSLQDYLSIVTIILEMAALLEKGIAQLSTKDLQSNSENVDLILELYDQVVEGCARESAELLMQDDVKKIIRHKDMLAQLKEIAKRIHITANTLEDMAIKVT